MIIDLSINALNYFIMINHVNLKKISKSLLFKDILVFHNRVTQNLLKQFCY